MATRKDNNLMGYNPLAWMDEDKEQESPSNQSVPAVAAADPLITTKTEDTTIDTTVDTAQRESVVKNTICLEETPTIQSVGRLHEQLITVFDKHNRIEIDASKVSSIDTANLQLLIILKQEAIKLHKEVLINSPSARFKEAAGLLGIAAMLDVAG